MQDSTQHTIRSTFEASNEGRIHFGQVIGQLVEAGVESYHVDYRCGRSTYFLPDGESLDLTFEKPAEGIADTFDGDAVHAAIRGACGFRDKVVDSICGLNEHAFPRVVPAGQQFERSIECAAALREMTGTLCFGK